MTLLAAAQQALEALDLLAKSEHPATNFTTKSGGRIYPHKVAVDAGAALRTALAEPEQEPEQNTVTCVCGAVWEGNLMVHAPRQRKPLTEPELHEVNPTWPAPGQHWDYEDVLEFVRAIERAHGIGGEA